MLHLWLTLQECVLCMEEVVVLFIHVYCQTHIKKGAFALKFPKSSDQALPNFTGKNPRAVPENTEFDA
jgi:hypothetical protein